MADKDAFQKAVVESLSHQDFAKKLFEDQEKKQFIEMIATTYYTNELDFAGIIQFLGDLIEEDDKKTKIAQHIVDLKKKMTANVNRPADKRPPPKETRQDKVGHESKKKVKTQTKKQNSKADKKNENSQGVKKQNGQAEGQGGDQKKGLKQELQNEGKTKCRFFPFCKNPDTCEFFHPTEKCQYFPRCRFGENCLYVHEACKFNQKCTKMNCPYAHSNKKPSNPLEAFMKQMMAKGGAGFGGMMKQQPYKKKKYPKGQQGAKQQEQPQQQ